MNADKQKPETGYRFESQLGPEAIPVMVAHNRAADLMRKYDALTESAAHSEYDAWVSGLVNEDVILLGKALDARDAARGTR